MSRYARDSHMYTRTTGWLLFGALRRSASFTELRTGAATENGKEVEYALLNLDVEFKPHLAKDGTTLYEIIDGDWPMRLVVRESGRPPDHRYKLRLNGRQLEQLLHESTIT